MESFFYTREQVRNLPTEPGVYRFFNKDQKIIYVGKAKNLKKRVSSYFKKNIEDRKTRRMASEIQRIEVTIVNSESDALLLENSLIKSYQPKYNILLRDDKSFPYICITRERFPKVIVTRQVEKAKGFYFGPYTSGRAMNTILDLIRNIFTIRTCNFNLSEENIREGKFKICLEYHIGNCKGPCEGLQSEEDYNKDIDQIKYILKGHLGDAKSYLQLAMQEAAAELDFEKAQDLKEKLQSLENYQAKSQVVNPKLSSVDVITMVSDEKMAFINYMTVMNGAIIHSQTVEVKKKLDEDDNEILPLVMMEMRDKFDSTSRDVLTNIQLENEIEDINVVIPQIGDKKKLLDLSLKNALYYKKEHYSRVESKKEGELRVLKQLQQDLGLPEMPTHIECFDNSNIQGTNPVASMVCFKNGRPSKKDYRKFNIKTVEGPDDFASMNEIVGRRYKRLKEEAAPLPKLIVIDGGKGQLSAACQALKDLDLYGKIPIIGIAKRLEEIYFPADPYPIHIDKRSESLKLIQRTRDEAHRFAITFHRDKRSKSSFKTGLEDVKGIGPKTADKLLKEFKSAKKIKEAPIEEIAKIIGQDKAEKLKEALK